MLDLFQGRKLLKIATAVVIIPLVNSTSPAVGETVDEQWSRPNTPQEGHYSIIISDSDNGWGHFSILRTKIGDEELICKSTSDGDCAKSQSFHFQAVLPACVTSSQLDCVDSLRSLNGEGKVDDGTFDFYTMPDHPNLYEADPAIGMPAGASPGVWRLNGTPHSVGNQYALAVTIQGGANRGSRPNSPDINIALSAVLPKAGTASTDRNGFENYPKCIQRINTDGVRFVGCGAGAEEYGSYACSFKTTNGGCLLREPFPNNTRFQVRIRLSTTPSGWLHGRMESPDISIYQITGGSLIDISAAPLRVPIVYGARWWNQLPESVQSYYKACFDNAFTCHVGTRIPDSLFVGRPLDRLNVMDTPDPSNKAAMRSMAQWRDLTEDSSVAEPTTWTVRTTMLQDGQTKNTCFAPDTSGVKGIVTTNASAYSDGPPTFENGSLTYTVMAPHFRPDKKSLFLGRYNLVLRSDVARCLYGFTSAPIQASVSVINSEGANIVATTSVSEKNGWLRLAAEGFTFSQPQIIVKLDQPKIVIIKPTAAPVTKKVTITCTKGKQTKKVWGTIPNCPAGWRVKK